MAYDRADWHYGGNYPEGLPNENGGTHIGMFLAWAILHDLIGDLHLEHSVEALAAVRERRMTGRDFLFNQCDERFWEEDLSDLGNAFARDYYDSKAEGCFLDDYEEALAGDLPTLYDVEDTWVNYDKLGPMIDRRFEDWKARIPGTTSP